MDNKISQILELAERKIKVTVTEMFKNIKWKRRS